MTDDDSVECLLASPVDRRLAISNRIYQPSPRRRRARARAAVRADRGGRERARTPPPAFPAFFLRPKQPPHVPVNQRRACPDVAKRRVRRVRREAKIPPACCDILIDCQRYARRGS